MTRTTALFDSGRLCAALALIQAVALWGLHQAVTSNNWPASDPGVLVASYLVAFWVPPTLYLLWSHRQQAVLWWTVAALAAFLAFTGYQSFDQLSAPIKDAEIDEGQIIGFAAPVVILWLIFLPLLRSRLESGRWRAPYEVLFRGTWRSCLTLAESILFTILFWALLGLWSTLFNELLGNPFFRDLFSDPRFYYPATTLAFAAATQIIGTSDRLIDGVLDQILELLKWLLPLAGLIVIAFTLALLPRLPELFGSGEKVISSWVLLALVAATVLLINAAYRDGATEPGYTPFLRQALRLVPLFLTVVAATALYSLVVRTTSLGLTPARYWGLVTAAFAVLYAAGYAVAALRGGAWLGAIKNVNFTVAILLLTTLAVSVTPLADPTRWSISSQLNQAIRSDSTEVREGAMQYLRFDSGSQGRLALETIATGRRASDASIRAQAASVLALTSRKREPKVDPGATQERYSAWRNRLQIMPEGRSIPDGLEAALKEEFSFNASRLDSSGKPTTPLLFFVDLNEDGTDDCVLISGPLRGDPQIMRDYRSFVVIDGVWRRSSSSRPTDP